MSDHGTPGRYRLHTLAGEPACAPCREVERARKAAYRARVYLQRGPSLIDATGTRRRLQALTAMGWSAAELSLRLDVTRSAIAKTISRRMVHRATAAAVAALYDELSMTAGPSAVARRIAAKNGWPPPLAWDDDTVDDPTATADLGQRDVLDEVAVQRALSGRTVRLAKADRAELARRLTAAGRSAHEISVVLGVDRRTVVRYRAAA